ncbi:DUF3049 domain-containing protein [Cephalotus follicularis]|uniref:DUF3049 domain-containing protein n=1 Tax=Cephalotus follicularis TaxID=3775 RepID=A0A1Q3CQ70_CEPFO|nr:DUF3049 domain-containing protein [Cephalotus follicularis]
MSPCLSKSLRLSSTLKIKEEAMVTKKQGIVSILGSDSEIGRSTNIAAASLRRTLSADMSSKKWLNQNGFFSPLKKTASSDSVTELSSDDEEDYGHDNNNKKNIKKPCQCDIWSSILPQKGKEESNCLPSIYVHPLARRSASSLTEKSLEICTESLGSETGSDGFSSYPPSEIGEVEEDKEEEQPEIYQAEHEEKGTESLDGGEFRLVKYNYVNKAPQNRPFPPPLPSLSSASLRVKSHRDNGRLVLEAVSVSSLNNFHAQRQDGRLVLTFATGPLNEDEVRNEELEKNQEEFDEEFCHIEEEEKEEDEEDKEIGGEDVDRGGDKENGYLTEILPKLSRGVISVQRLALMMHKPTNRNSTWPNKFNETVKFVEEGKVEEPTPLAQSLPPRPPRLIPSLHASALGPAAASLNAYEYYWRPKPMAAAGITQQLLPVKNSNNELTLPKNPMANGQQQLITSRGNRGDYLGCKERKRALLFWERQCIATS